MHDDDIYPVVALAERCAVPGTDDHSPADAAATAGGGPGANDAGDRGVAAAVGADATATTATSANPEDDGMLVRIRESERQIALRCDAVNSQEEVVVKPLEGILSGTPGLSGTAVLGDGNIVHTLDVVTI
jgi:two-component system chemotaxis sensor kinase CheA